MKKVLSYLGFTTLILAGFLFSTSLSSAQVGDTPTDDFTISVAPDPKIKLTFELTVDSPVEYDDGTVFFGSLFSENIGKRHASYGVKTDTTRGERNSLLAETLILTLKSDMTIPCSDGEMTRELFDSSSGTVVYKGSLGDGSDNHFLFGGELNNDEDTIEEGDTGERVLKVNQNENFCVQLDFPPGSKHQINFNLEEAFVTFNMIPISNPAKGQD